MGSVKFNETGKFNDLPNLSYFNYCQAKNGGPIGKLTFYSLSLIVHTHLFSHFGER